MRSLNIKVLGPLFLYSFYTFAQATNIYYMRANINEPWCCGWAPVANTNPTEMDAVFGVGGWTLAYYETADAATIFSTNTCYVYMEGGDGHATEMETFFSANQSTIENWVSNGGSLFMNAAPNEDNGMSYGFGGVNLIYSFFMSSVTVHPTATTHPIWTGPFTPVVTTMTGTSYTHARIGGGGTSPILKDSYSSAVALSEKSWGSGHVFFGGMTVTGWHSPFTESSNLRKNMHSYLSDLCTALLLPIEFSRFEAGIENKMVRLDWETSSEYNNDFFTVERSEDLNNWQPLLIVDGAGTSTEILNYLAYDEHPVYGISYYRIKQTDLNGKSTYSEVKTILFNSEIAVYPVPANQFVDFFATDADAYQIKILNQMGEKVECNFSPSSYKVRIDLSELAGGIYYLQFGEGDQTDYRVFSKL